MSWASLPLPALIHFTRKGNAITEPLVLPGAQSGETLTVETLLANGKRVTFFTAKMPDSTELVVAVELNVLRKYLKDMRRELDADVHAALIKRNNT